MEIQERIVASAEEMFFQFGIRSVTMDDIARELGISKKTIYQHFPDKDTLVFEATRNSLEKEKRDQQKIYEKAENPIDEIIQATRLMRKMFENMKPSLFFDLQKYYPKAWQLYVNHKTRFIELVSRNMKEGVEQGLYRAQINVDILAKLRIESVELAFNNDVFPPSSFSLLEIHLEFVDHFIRGIVTPRGLQLYETYI